MNTSTWNDLETAKAEQIWSQYQQSHDLSGQIGKTAGIDPASGRVWVGESIPDVLAMRTADGFESLLYFVRVGSSTYYRKGGRG
jgi:hypothetical protein